MNILVVDDDNIIRKGLKKLIERLSEGYEVIADFKNGRDALEFMLAGASAISIGAGNFIDPYTSINTVKEIEEYMKKYNIRDIKDIIGKVEMN